MLPLARVVLLSRSRVSSECLQPAALYVVPRRCRTAASGRQGVPGSGSSATRCGPSGAAPDSYCVPNRQIPSDGQFHGARPARFTAYPTRPRGARIEAWKRGRMKVFFTLWKLAALRRAAAPASALRHIWQGIRACVRGEFHHRCRIDAESTVRIARHRSLMPLP